LTFEEYLVQKKIDSAAFKQAEPERFEEFSSLFAQVHPNSFTVQKLNLINSIRRRYQLKEEPKPLTSEKKQIEIEVPVLKTEENKEPSKPGIARPAFKRKIS
jgi:hypothetical protein